MRLTIDRTLNTRVKRASKELGLPENEFVQRAITSFIDETGDIAALYRDLRAWDVASARTMQKYGF